MVVALIVVAVGGGYLYIRHRFDQIPKVKVSGLRDARPPGKPENILLVGDNSRCALQKYSSFYAKNSSHFGTCAKVGGGRSDVIMILRLDPATHSASLLSIPRDSWVPIAGGGAEDLKMKVDDALNTAEDPYLHLQFGPSLLVKTIEQDFGIPIDHYVELNFYTFEKVVNILGGVNLDFPTELVDHYSGLRITKTGCLHLDGAQALAFVRARHLYYKDHGVWRYDGTGDLGRIKRNHIFLRVLASEVEHGVLHNPITANRVFSAIVKAITVDKGFTFSDLFHLVLEFRHVSPNSVPAATLPVIVWNHPYQDHSNPTNYQAPGEVVFPFEPEDQQVIDTFLGRTQAPWASVTPSSVTVSVLDGAGDPAGATRIADGLGRLGFAMRGVGTAADAGSPAETVVRYRAGEELAAEKVVSELSGEVVMTEGPTADGAAVTVITGTAVAVASPRSSTTTPSSSSTSTTTSSSSSSTSTTTPAQQQVSQLAQRDLWSSHHSRKEFWWDPTACPAGVTPQPA